jgi:hypothetical protein
MRLSRDKATMRASGPNPSSGLSPLHLAPYNYAGLVAVELAVHGSFYYFFKE